MATPFNGYIDTNCQFKIINSPAQEKNHEWPALPKALVLFPSQWATPKTPYMFDSDIDIPINNEIIAEADYILLADKSLVKQEHAPAPYITVTGFETKTRKKIRIYFEKKSVRQWFSDIRYHNATRLLFIGATSNRNRLSITVKGKKKKIYIHYVPPTRDQKKYIHFIPPTHDQKKYIEWLTECHVIEINNHNNGLSDQMCTYSLPLSETDETALAQCECLVTLNEGDKLVMPPKTYGMVLDMGQQLAFVINPKDDDQVVNGGGMFAHSDLLQSQTYRYSYACIPIKKTADGRYQLFNVKTTCPCEDTQFYTDLNHIVYSMKRRKIEYSYEVTRKIGLFLDCYWIWGRTIINIGELFTYKTIKQSNVITADTVGTPPSKTPRYLVDLAASIIHSNPQPYKDKRHLPNPLRRYLDGNAMNCNYLGGLGSDDAESASDSEYSLSEDDELTVDN